MHALNEPGSYSRSEKIVGVQLPQLVPDEAVTVAVVELVATIL